MTIDTLIICHRWAKKVNNGFAQVGNVRVVAYEDLDRFEIIETEYKIIYVEDTLKMNEIMLKLQSKGIKVTKAQWKRYYCGSW